MLRHLAVSALALALAAPALAAGPTSPPSRATLAEGKKLHALFDRDWEWTMRDQPTFATQVGDLRYNDRWPDMSPAAIAARRAYTRKLHDEIKAIDRAKLSEADRLNYDLFARQNDVDLEGERFPEEYLAMDQMGGVHAQLADTVQSMPLETARHYRDVLARIGRYPALVEQNIALLRRGLAAGITQPRVLLGEVPALIGNQIADKPEDSPVYQVAFQKMPAGIDANTQAALRAEARKLIGEQVMPALRALKRFFAEEYLPKARDSIALTALPEGKAWYAHRVRDRTTTDLTPDQIHQIGLDEVKRIRGEMERAMRDAHFNGDLPAFFRFLKTDKRFFFTDKNALLMGYRDIAKRIDPELPKLFGTLPRLTYGVFPVPAYSEKTQTTAYYQAGSGQTGRSGRFYANTYDLNARPKWEMEALTLHEAVPGHHLQIAITQELPEAPNFRRYGFFTAFVEGWGLYAESLGPELGLYQDPYSKFGQLTYEMWRAIRLVVDTGMHAKGWTRQQSIQFFLDNTGKTQHDIEVEVDRYIAWAGQALAYKLGELKIKELRGYASHELGERFSLRDFHDQVLGAGALPLDVLTARIHAWVEQQKRAPDKSHG